MQLAEYAAQSQSPYIKRDEIERELIRSFDLRNPEKFIKTDEELMQEQMQMMMAQQQQQEQAKQREQEQASQEMQKEMAGKVMDAVLGGGEKLA